MYFNTSLPKGRYAMYLRKSREDVEAELRGKFDTLELHEAKLKEFAKNVGITDYDIYRELCSGDALFERTEFMKILTLVSQGYYVGILAVDEQRVTRGDLLDQGIILAKLRTANCLIVTPNKIYDLNNESDDNDIQFRLMYSRMEYRRINTRLSNGMVGAVEKGRYVATRAPFGYDKVTVNGLKTLKPNKWAPIVQQWYNRIASRSDGVRALAFEASRLDIPSYTGTAWDPATVRTIIRNPVYKGMVRWCATKTITTRDEQMRQHKHKVRNDDPLIKPGLHKAIVSEELWQAANDVLNERTFQPPDGRKLKNPLADLLRCKYCGRAMERKSKPNQRAISFRHPTSNRHLCWQAGCGGDRLMELLSKSLEGIIADLEYVDSAEEESLAEGQIKALEAAITNNRRAIDNLFRLAEKGMITDDEFAERKKSADRRISDCKTQIDSIIARAKQTAAKAESVYTIRTAIELICDYHDRGEEVNSFLKSFISVIEYEKDPDTGELKLNIVLK